MMRFCNLLVVSGCLLACGLAHAEYPDKPIKLLVTTPPGGAADAVARTVGTALAKVLNVAVVVDNRGGASGTIAANAVAKAAPDGYTLLQNSITTHGIGPYVFPSLPYDSWKDFEPVSLLASMPMFMVVNPYVKEKNVGEVIAASKASGSSWNFASSGSGSAPHLVGEMFNSVTGAKLTHVPYKGSGPAAMDVAGGQAQVMFDALPSLMPYIQSGKFRPMAVLGEKSPLFPNLPTFAELGYPEINASIWYGVLAPHGTPPDIVQKLNAALRTVLASPDVVAPLAKLGIKPSPNSPEEFQKFMVDDYKRWGKVIRDGKINVN